MPVRQSAGLLMFQLPPSGVEFLLAHPGGPLFAKKDAGHWTIPKGEPNEGETDLLQVAQREFSEETGLVANGPFLPLGSIQQKGGKVVHAWGVAWDHTRVLPPLQSNLFEMEWPPHSGRRAQFPEVDRVTFMDLQKARLHIKPAQEPLLDRLLEALRAAGQPL